MNRKHLARLFLGTGLAAGLAAGLWPLQAESGYKPQHHVQIEIDGGQDAGPMLDNLYKNLSGSLDDSQKADLQKAIDSFKEQMKNSDGSSPKKFKFEWKSGGDDKSAGNNTPRKAGRDDPEASDDAKPQKKRGRVRPGQDSTDDAAESPFGRQLREQLRGQGMDLDQFFGPGGIDKLFNRMFGEDRPEADPHGGQGSWDNLFGNVTPRPSSKYEKANRRALAEFRPVLKEARESVVLIERAGQQLALGTIVTRDGYALTKASLMPAKGRLECVFHDGSSAPAEIVDRLKGYDLALLKIDAKDLRPIEWNTAERLPVGTLLAAAAPDEDPLAVGVISVPLRNLDSSRKGFLGIGMDAVDGGVMIASHGGRSKGVTEGSAAEKAGLKEGDIITAVDGKPVKSPKELTDIITGRKAGDDVTVSYRRGGEDKTAVATLGSRNEIKAATTMDGRDINESELRKMQRQFDPTARMGGRGNEVADGFPQAIQNDLTIQPNECGGPAVDIEGKAVGINIARAERTATYAIPAAAVQKLLAAVGEGKLTEPKDKSDLKREASAASREVEELQKKLDEARAKAQAAKDALEKSPK